VVGWLLVGMCGVVGLLCRAQGTRAHQDDVTAANVSRSNESQFMSR
jgi:hypothetical protein